ncbi:hypothetical protein N7456_011827 [Penicillium angulare]|uniref:Uncharacterized protein n=1 Tax=Penicillium angulare TaxID=116970 RepID=A0A9W9EUQ3_9EURO|nr:hypothetical protein N7456_011827 [Penicillium angulare]
MKKKREYESMQIYVFAIDKKEKQATKVVRRGEDDDRISALPESTRAAAVMAEEQRRAEWGLELAAIQARTHSRRLHPSSTVVVSHVQSTASSSNQSTTTSITTV